MKNGNHSYLFSGKTIGNNSDDDDEKKTKQMHTPYGFTLVVLDKDIYKNLNFF